MEYEYVIVYTDISMDGFIEQEELTYTKLSHAKKIIESPYFWMKANLIVKRLINHDGDIIRYVHRIWVYKNGHWHSTRKVKKYRLWLLEDNL